MGLNLDPKPIRRHILNLDPLPDLDKAFAIVINAESEKEVSQTYSTTGVEASALMVKGQNSRTDGDRIKDGGKRIGYATTATELKEARKGNSNSKKVSVNMAATSNGENQENDNGKQVEERQTELASMVSQIIKQEMGKFLKNKEAEEHINFANLVNFAGNVMSGNFLSLTHGSWILDTEASSHICSNINLMQHVVSLDPSTKDLKSEEIIAVAGVRRNLYVLESKSFNPFVIKQFLSDCGSLPNTMCNAIPNSNENTSVLWHQRLGHCPLSMLNYIDFFKNSELKQLPICDICHYAKQNRLPFPISQTRSQRALKLLHIDVWGPYAIGVYKTRPYPIYPVRPGHFRDIHFYESNFPFEKSHDNESPVPPSPLPIFDDDADYIHD
ncbi:Retrovirus-related Pol polyprotein from transposon TNT 1-94 [Senna tora]|uniref:Retrovirus-related Pol polyprotein from transposon TNT 1-94 n=1 Tax=Senna tora TaxID=362788 RepID=A0A834TR92_9FABA|nr:Retrovirus-related Pol polyprotein from transposon TNT 1-94 [Senna tora]